MIAYPNREREQVANTLAMLVSHELLGEHGLSQVCSHEPNADRLVFPATDNRPLVSIALPLTLTSDRLRDVVANTLSAYISALPPDALPR